MAREEQFWILWKISYEIDKKISQFGLVLTILLRENIRSAQHSHLQMTFSVPRRHLLGSLRAVLDSVENFILDRHKFGSILPSIGYFIAGKLQMAQLTQLGANFDPIHICWSTFSAISADPLNRIGPFEWQNVPHKVLLALTQLLRGLLAALCRYWTFCDLYLKFFTFK